MSDTVEAGEAIYATVPDTLVTNDDVERVRKVLEKTDRFLTARRIAEAAGMQLEGTQPATRKSITVLLEEMHVPVVSCSKGFMLATSGSMMRAYLRDLESRRRGLERRIDAVKTIIAGMLIDGTVTLEDAEWWSKETIEG